MSKQKYTVSLADTATEADSDGVKTTEGVIEVPADETAEEAALDYALARGQKDGKHYLVVDIKRGDA